MKCAGCQPILTTLIIDFHLIQGILIREAFIIRHVEDLVTFQLVYKRGTFAVKIGIRNVAFPVTGFSSTSY